MKFLVLLHARPEKLILVEFLPKTENKMRVKSQEGNNFPVNYNVSNIKYCSETLSP